MLGAYSVPGILPGAGVTCEKVGLVLALAVLQPGCSIDQGGQRSDPDVEVQWSGGENIYVSEGSVCESLRSA